MSIRPAHVVECDECRALVVIRGMKNASAVVRSAQLAKWTLKHLQNRRWYVVCPKCNKERERRNAQITLF